MMGLSIAILYNHSDSCDNNTTTSTVVTMLETTSTIYLITTRNLLNALHDLSALCWIPPVLLLLIYLSPILSASVWFFWMFASLILGAFRFIYASYQILMIYIDLIAFSILKSLSFTGSQFRRCKATVFMDNKMRPFLDSRKKTVPLTFFSSWQLRGRQEREWKQKLSQANCFQDFSRIEVDEPENECKGVTKKPYFTTMNFIHVWIVRNVSLFARRMIHDIKSLTTRIASFSSSSSADVMLSSSPPLLSSRTEHRGYTNQIFDHQPSLLSSSSLESAPEENRRSFTFSFTSNSGRSSFLSSGSPGNMDDVRNGPPCKIEQELGSTGPILMATIKRLQETRLQAQNTPAVFPTGFHYDPTVSAHTIPRIITTGASADDRDDVEETSVMQDFDCSIISHKAITKSANFSYQAVDSAVSALKFLLTGVVKRNHLGAEKLIIDDARSVAESGQYRYSKETRDLIADYHKEVEQCLELLAMSNSNLCTKKIESTRRRSLILSQQAPGPTTIRPHDDQHEAANYAELADRVSLMRKLQQNVGRTALMLSGGGAQAMYHVGAIKVLCETGVYDGISVISGASGGSIVAALCAIKTKEELLQDVCVPHLSTDYMLTGEMRRRNIRWFPSIVDMGFNWLQHGFLVDSKEFKRCCDFYFGDTTFAEAFERTGKHVCISVSASRAGDTCEGGAQRLLLNHISTPHVTLASAVAASCAIPGVMAPAKLVAKNYCQELEYFEVDGFEWIDGSIQADLPFKRISTLFNVSNCIVSQTNFFVVPFLQRPRYHNMRSWYSRLFQLCEWDIRSRALNLARLGLFPKIFGHDVSNIFKQRYYGDLTIIHHLTTRQLFGLQLLVTPTVEDMQRYIQIGESAAWPQLRAIREIMRVELTIDRCIDVLTDRLQFFFPEISPHNDDLESVLSTDCTSCTLSPRNSIGTLHFLKREAYTETILSKMKSLERENIQLRKTLKNFGHPLEQDH